MGNQVAYSFDQVAGGYVYDQSGYLYNLELTGGVAAQGHGDSGSVGGMNCAAGGGKTLIWDGTSSAAVSGLASNAWGLMAWVKSNPGASGEQVLFHCGPAGGTGVDTFTLYAAASDGFIRLRRNGVNITTTVSILDGAWHHVSFQAGGDVAGVRIKVDDVVVATGAVTTISSASTAIPWVGVGQTVGGTLKFNGVMDDVRILNDPIDSVAHATTNELFMDTPVYNQLMCEYGFREGAGTVAEDTSGWNRDMALTASGQWLPSTGFHGGGMNPGNSAAAGMANAFGLADTDLVHTDRATPMFWIYVPSTANGGVYTIFDIRDTAGNLKFEALLQTNATTTASVYLRIYDAAGAQWAASINITINTNEWAHVGVAIYPTGYQPYRNGVIYTGTDSVAANPLTGWDKLRIGAGRFPAIPSSMGIRLDDVRVVNNYLYPEAILKQMAAESGAPPSAVVVSLDTRWNVRAEVQKSLSTSWNIRTALEKALSTTWHIRTGLTKSLNTEWHVRSEVVKSLPVEWHARSEVVKSLAIAWNIESEEELLEVIASLDTRWHVRSSLTKALDTRWHVRGFVVKSLDTRWNVLVEVGGGGEFRGVDPVIIGDVALVPYVFNGTEFVESKAHSWVNES